MSEEDLRRELASASCALHARGWVANHDGNLSARLNGLLLATPTAVSKGDVTPDMLITVDAEGQVVSGTRKPFSELRLHRVVFAARPDVEVVIHAHPPTATGFAVAGLSFGAPFMAEPVVSLGAEIPLVPYGMVGDASLDMALGDAFRRADVALLANHGVFSVGPSVEVALLRMELVEHLAKIALVARQLGGARPIPAADISRLMEQRQRAGLGPARVESSRSERVTGVTSRPADFVRPAPADVGKLVEETLRRFRS